jgi:hypothetical protein
MDQLTLPPDRPRWAVITVRTIQTVLAVLALAVAALTAGARPAPDRDRPPAGLVVLVTDTTLAQAGYSPVPAGPPCAAEPSEVLR